MSHLGQPAALGWRLAESSFTTAEYAQDAGKEDPVARRLRHEVGIYKGRERWSDEIGSLTAQDLFEAGPPSGEVVAEGVPWPTTPEEMPGRIRRAVSYLQAEKRKFWDPGYSHWCASMRIDHPRDMEKVCKVASLHAERWTNEGTGEEI